MRILCADDEEDIRTILSLALSLDPEFEIEIVESGVELLARARAAPGAYDAFLLDAMMPEMDGYETCRQLKADAATASVPVVFLTAKTQRTDVARAMDLGAVGCLTKPFDPITIAGELKTTLGW